MNGLERTLAFIQGKPVDRPPFHPIVMRWAARHAGVQYRRFCLEAEVKASAMVKAAENFDIDWISVMSDPYCEAQAYGLQVEYPENSMPVDKGGHLEEAEDIYNLQPYDLSHHRLQNKIREVEELVRLGKGRYFVCGWVEGPMAEYADIRGVSEAAMDLIDEPEAVAYAMKLMVDSAIPLLQAQVKAGAHCIGVGDAFASQIGPKLYKQFVFEEERRLVAAIHDAGALAKLHICGDTSLLLPDMIRTGADIIDVDHLVPSMAPFAELLTKRQVLSGSTDPVSVIERGSPEEIRSSVIRCHNQTNGRCIVSAGCEITPDTTIENMRAFGNAAKGLETQLAQK